jgi:hypothetical protein
MQKTAIEIAGRACPNAVHKGGGVFRCQIVDQAHQEAVTLSALESVTYPIGLHLKGGGSKISCLYGLSGLYPRCFGARVNSDGRRAWIRLAQERARQVVLRGHEAEVAQIFGASSIQPIREALARPPVNICYVISRGH